MLIVDEVTDHLLVTDGMDGAAVMAQTVFWTLPQLGTPFSLNRFTVRPGSNFLQLRWSHKDLKCIGSYIVKMCKSGQTKECATEMITTESKR